MTCSLKSNRYHLVNFSKWFGTVRACGAIKTLSVSTCQIYQMKQSIRLPYLEFIKRWVPSSTMAIAALSYLLPSDSPSICARRLISKEPPVVPGASLSQIGPCYWHRPPKLLSACLLSAVHPSTYSLWTWSRPFASALATHAAASAAH